MGRARTRAPGARRLDRAARAGARESARLFTVALHCEPDEHRRRIMGEDRVAKGKIRDAAYVDRTSRRGLIERGNDDSLRLDVTRLAADEAAATIAAWLSMRVSRR